MSVIRASGWVCALALFGVSTGPVGASDCAATEVFWRRCCRPPTCCCKPAPRCGPIRRWLGWCCPAPVVVGCPCLPAPYPAYAAPPLPAAPPSFPGPAVAPPAGPAPSPYPPPARDGNFQPQRLPAPAQPLTPPRSPSPVRLDRIVSFPGGN